jgi:hypothetical protein
MASNISWKLSNALAFGYFALAASRVLRSTSHSATMFAPSAEMAMSDPPYYTACPNPVLEDFVRHYGKPYEGKAKEVSKRDKVKKKIKIKATLGCRG